MLIECGAKSDVGQVRTNNEDNFAVDEELGLFVVADGMGGHNSGEVASKIATDIIAKNLHQSLRQEKETDKTQVMFGQNDPRFSEPANHLVSAVRLANQVIYEASNTYAQNRGMGTTVVALLARESSYVIAWVGDSRIYLIRHGQIQQLTADHSLVEEQVSKGLITKEQAEVSEMKNVLTRALGAEENVDVDVAETPAFENDYLILCSDGLTRMVEDSVLLETVTKIQKPQEICDQLVALANKNGGRDNVTVITVNRKAQNLWDKFLKTVSKIS